MLCKERHRLCQINDLLGICALPGEDGYIHGVAILHQRFFQFLSVLHAQVDFLSGQKINIFKLLVLDVFHQHFHSMYPISEVPEYARSDSMYAM